MKTQDKKDIPMCRCSKESIIDSLDKKVDELNTVVHKSTNGDSLMGMAKSTNDTVNEMKADVRSLLTFQTVVETQREMKDELEEKKRKKMQVRIALISLAAGSVLTLLGMILSALVK
jgi:hypothetical protein